jgi:alpha-glucosidase
VSAPWWKSAVVYQIYPRSFCDTDGNGVGDLEGIRRRLDHLVWLGVDALWISPFYRSPMKDYGYDVADFCDVDPLFGTLADFDRLLADAHERGLRVLVDWVPNHTSDRHPWFVESRASRTSPKRGWYVWRDGTPDRPPNNWRAAFIDGPAWTWDEPTRQWYLHLFLREQPDLDWNDPEVVEAMHATLRFWLDRGVDGFRMDVAHCIGKDPALADLPAEHAAVPACALNDDARTHPLLEGIRRVLEEYPGERIVVGEVFLLDTTRIGRYYGDGDQLHLAFNFPPLFAPWQADDWRRHIATTARVLDPRDAWPTWVLSNHDFPRHRTRYGSEPRARAAAVLLLTLRGTPFIYAGEELGLEDAVVPEERRLDPGNRDGCRAPIPWDETPSHGWPTEDPWLPWPPRPDVRNAATLKKDERSIVHLYRSLLALRRTTPALTQGTLTLLDAPDGVVAYERRRGGQVCIVLINFTDAAMECPLAEGGTVALASDDVGEGQPYRGRLGASQAVVVSRA